MCDKIEKIIGNMSLREKAAQLTQINAEYINKNSQAEITGAYTEQNLDVKDVCEIGSVLNFTDGDEAAEVQRLHLIGSTQKIPLLFMHDVIHGYRTVFPIPLALGCSFDDKLIEYCAAVSAAEAKANGVNVTFSPMVDLCRDARWGRVMESTGEDPYLNGRFGRAFIRGYKKGGIACCIKHFAAYGAAESGRDYNTVDMSQRSLYEYYLKPYLECLKENPEMIMTSFNALNGVPVNGHKDLLVDLLRIKMGFDGVIISDYAAIREMITHGYVEDEKQCALIAAENGVDIEMMSFTYIKYLEELVSEGKLKEEQIDRMVERVLKLKQKMGLFENPYTGIDSEKAQKICLSDEYRLAAKQAAVKSAVLLKNNGVLPLDTDKETAFIGPFADEKNIIGFWSCHGKSEESVTVKEGAEKLLGRAVGYAKGCGSGLSDYDESGIEKAVSLAKDYEQVVICVGEKMEDSGEGASRTKLNLTKPQLSLIEEVKKTGKKVVLLVFAGRPLVLSDAEKYADAILYMWQPGTEGGNAAAELVFGKQSPEGKTTMSFPLSVGQCPIYYNRFNTGRPAGNNAERYTSHYIDSPNTPLYPFGYGLQYTSFEISDLRVSSKTFKADQKLSVAIAVKNTGDREGRETVQLYIHDLFASAVRPVKELKAFKKVSVKAGEQIDVVFDLDIEAFKFYNAQLEYIAEKGEFDIMVGNSSENLLIKRVSLI